MDPRSRQDQDSHFSRCTERAENGVPGILVHCRGSAAILRSKSKSRPVSAENAATRTGQPIVTYFRLDLRLGSGLLFAQGVHGVYVGSAEGWREGGDHRDKHQHQSYGEEDGAVEGSDLKKQIGDQPGSEE